jgi:hypothetical protein
MRLGVDDVLALTAFIGVNVAVVVRAWLRAKATRRLLHAPPPPSSPPTD